MPKVTVGYISDLHLEQANKIYNSRSFKRNKQAADWVFDIPPPEHELDILVVVGDTCESRFEDIWAQGLTIISKLAKRAIVIPGNHENWNSNDIDSVRTIQALVAQFPNITFLNNESVTIFGISFFGTCLWTDYSGHSEHALRLDPKRGTSRHSDVNFAKTKLYNSGRQRLTYEDLCCLNQDCVKSIQTWLKQSKDTMPKVLLSHYPPLRESAERQWADEDLSDLDRESLILSDYCDLELDLIEKDITLVHGHTHKVHTYISKRGVKVHCNPRGHDKESAATYKVETFTLST